MHYQEQIVEKTGKTSPWAACPTASSQNSRLEREGSDPPRKLL